MWVLSKILNDHSHYGSKYLGHIAVVSDRVVYKVPRFQIEIEERQIVNNRS
jgi:hypothetical protein